MTDKAVSYPAKTTGADGKTEVHHLPGVGLVVRAVDFNALYAAREQDRARAAAPDPYREHLAEQAENIDLARLGTSLVRMGVACAGDGKEGFAARLADNVNRLTLAVDALRPPAAAPQAAVGVSDAPYSDEARAIAWVYGYEEARRHLASKPEAPAEDELLAEAQSEGFDTVAEYVAAIKQSKATYFAERNSAREALRAARQKGGV